MSLQHILDTPRCEIVSVRDATRSDYAMIRDVVRAAYGQYQAVVGPVLFARYLDDLLDLDRHERFGQLVVAETDGVVRGSAAFYPDTSVQGLGWPEGWAGGRALAVHPSARRYGVAQALLAECERRACRCGAPVFAFHTAEFMGGAVALYEQLGYRRSAGFDADLSAYFHIVDGPPVRALAYRRDLLPCVSRRSRWAIPSETRSCR
jgi:predicted N-acetyltransferase YhbS